ncbi:hypothetical protein [Chryseobacterium sp. YR221]|uniref:hypothetical protein n=1 Tax=Chryseobacterium sp. YR221 TaxID=1500293 RepID=UPI0009D8C1F6|nr:hypothetical protein [Chryseobacterium sp. YR221]SMC31573.1 hypothetical protein SAMN02787074_0212 [Chryseobacterium sp. YR221]
MAFQDIFNFSRSLSTGGSKAEGEISGFIPKEENESISTPPHDPFKPEKPVRQDPKIVRETSPQSGIIFDFIKSVTSDIKQSSDQVEKSMNTPSAVTDPAAGAMGKARETSDKVKDDTPASDIVITPPPKPKNDKPEGWDDKPKANNEKPDNWNEKFPQ